MVPLLLSHMISAAHCVFFRLGGERCCQCSCFLLNLVALDLVAEDELADGVDHLRAGEGFLEIGEAFVLEVLEETELLGIAAGD